MRVLLTNDDGIDAAGLATLSEIAATISDDVWTVAPLRNQSGVSHAFSMHGPLRIHESGPRRYAIDGTPADCVILALGNILPAPPDLVLSGVNFGRNIADDYYYSGTIAAAREAALNGLRAIALSQSVPDISESVTQQFECARMHGPELATRLTQLQLPRGCFLNVNFPSCQAGQVKGMKVARLGNRRGTSFSVEERRDIRNQRYFWAGGRPDPASPEPGTDQHAIHSGFIAITPCHTDQHYGWAGDALEAQLHDAPQQAASGKTAPKSAAS